MCVCVRDHSRVRANCATVTKIGMPDFIANTTVEFEIQIRHVTRSAVFTCFYLFCRVFPLFFHSKARANCATATKTGMPHFITHTAVEIKIWHRRIPRSAVFTCFYLFCPVFPLFFHSRACSNCAMATKTGMPHFIADTTVEFEIQPHRVTRSAVFTRFVPFSTVFPL